jgi:hypothetical protein
MLGLIFGAITGGPIGALVGTALFDEWGSWGGRCTVCDEYIRESEAMNHFMVHHPEHLKRYIQDQS